MLENWILLLPLICCMEVGNILDTPSNHSLKILKEMFKFNSNYLMNILMSLDVLHRNSNIEVSQNFPDPCIKDSVWIRIYTRCLEGRASGSHGASSWAQELIKSKMCRTSTSWLCTMGFLQPLELWPTVVGACTLLKEAIPAAEEGYQSIEV